MKTNDKTLVDRIAATLNGAAVLSLQRHDVKRRASGYVVYAHATRNTIAVPLDAAALLVVLRSLEPRRNIVDAVQHMVDVYGSGYGYELPEYAARLDAAHDMRLYYAAM